MVGVTGVGLVCVMDAVGDALEIAQPTLHAAQLDGRLHFDLESLELAPKEVDAFMGCGEAREIRFNPSADKRCTEFNNLLEVSREAGNPVRLRCRVA